MKRLPALVLIGTAVMGGMCPRESQAAGTRVHFPAGWNMIGVYDVSRYATFPEVRYVYVNGAYQPYSRLPASLSRSAPCLGGWAFFASPMDAMAATPLQAEGGQEISSLECPLHPGWNMVADPFSVPALLPAATLGYHWIPTRAAYDVVETVPPGESVWVYSPSGGSASFRAQT